MPKNAKKEQPELCQGGRSYNRRKHKHEAAETVNCYRCGAVMGCKACCEPPHELICLACNNWASRAGLEKHGDVVPSNKIQHVRTDRGWKHWQSGAVDQVGVGQLAAAKGME